MIRKPVDSLTAADFINYPAWEYAIGEEHLPGQDETTVRPYTGVVPINPDHGLVIVRAAFQLADGTTLPGTLYAQGTESRGLADIQPVILLETGENILFWHGAIKPTDQEIAKYLEMLGRTPEQIFPIHYQSEIAIIGGNIAGEIERFVTRA